MTATKTTITIAVHKHGNVEVDRATGHIVDNTEGTAFASVIRDILHFEPSTFPDKDTADINDVGFWVKTYIGPVRRNRDQRFN